GNGSFNAARLEFDFVPQSDSISFNFVFGSEEYLEFVNGGVNDAFGFFISGPNPAGGNFVDQNIAIILA
ncbi:MAG: choice-of-anchor L domain-containing protein, partial [Kordiimonadaceae bacterium]|nr:choice-of-anchor L domain-containing protein [Kordiimonadaceae bacterium]